MRFGRLVQQSPFTGIEPKTCIDVGSEHTPINISSRSKNFNTTTVAASATTDTKEVGQLISPLFSQVRELSINRFCVSGSQQQAVASSSQQQQAPSNVINSW